MILNRTMVRNDLAYLSDKSDKLFEECVSVFKYLTNIENVMVSEKEYIVKNGAIADFSYLQLDTLEEQEDLGDLNVIQAFILGVGSKDGCSHRRLERFGQEFIAFRKMAIELAEDYVPLTKEQIVSVADYVKQALGQLCYYMYYQFNLDAFMEDLNEGEEDIQTDLALYNYCDRNGMDIETLVKYIVEVKNTHKPHLPVFDECPDLEEEFYDIAGQYIEDTEILEAKLTSNDVKLILSGTVNVADIMSEIMSRKGNE